MGLPLWIRTVIFLWTGFISRSRGLLLLKSSSLYSYLRPFSASAMLTLMPNMLDQTSSRIISSAIADENMNLNNGLHLEGGWIGVVEQFKNSLNKNYLTLDYLNVKKLFFQQSITSTSNNTCINTLPTIYQCKTHASASTLLKNKSKEQSSPQLITIDSMISLNKWTEELLKTFNGSSYLNHFIFLPFNKYAQVINNIKNKN